MKINEIQDERIISLRRKIQSDAYQILVVCLIFSIIIQQFLLKAPFSEFAVELCCLIGIGIYTTLRHLMSGIDIWDSSIQGNKKIMISSLTTGIISTGIFTVLTGERRLWKLTLFLVIFSVCYFVIHSLIIFLSKKRQKQIDEICNDENE